VLETAAVDGDERELGGDEEGVRTDEEEDQQQAEGDVDGEPQRRASTAGTAPRLPATSLPTRCRRRRHSLDSS